MIISTIPASNCTPQTIVIGRRGTYDTMQIAFDLSYLVENYGSGTAVLAIKRSQDESAYPAVVIQEDNTLTWTITETDTYYVGSGECQLMWYVDGGLAKSIIYPMVVMRDILSTAEEPPDGYENWVEHLTELGAETLQNAQNAEQSASDAESAKDDAVAAKEAAENAQEDAEAAQQAAETAVTHYPKIVNSYWYVWTNGEWVNTGVKAEGVDGRGIVSVTGQKTSTVENVDTYTMTVVYTSGNPDTFTFTVTNGVDGYSPVVTITAITGGHRVTITDETHPTGQSFDVMDGEDSAVLSVAGKTGAVTLDANDVAFSESGTYDDGTVGAELSNQKNALNHVNDVLIADNLNAESIWEKGSINSSDGSDIYTGSDYYWRTKGYLSEFVSHIKIVNSSGTDYYFYVYAYENGVYKGQYKNGTIAPSQVSAWVYDLSITDLRESFPNYDFRLVFANWNKITYISDVLTSVFDNYVKTLIDMDVSGENENLFAVTKSDGGYLDVNGNKSDDLYDINRSSDYIKTNGHASITIQTWWSELSPDRTQWQAICFYDSNYTLIGSRNALTGENTLYQSYTVSVPSNAVYFRACARIYGNWKIKVQYGGLPTAWTVATDDQKTTIDGNNPSDDTFIKSVNHRGWYACPENTLIAFKNSKLQGYNYVETDVRFTSDGVAVLLHDATINRTARNTDGSELSSQINISDITYEQALTYDFGIYMGAEFAGVKIPTLNEFLRLCKNLSLRPYIELKESLTTSNVEDVINAVNNHGMIENTTVISTQTNLLNAAKTDNDSIRLGKVTNGGIDSVIADVVALKTGKNTVFITNTYTSNPETINLCADNQVPLEFWTIDNAGTLNSILTNSATAYVSGVITSKFITSNMAKYLSLQVT